MNPAHLHLTVNEVPVLASFTAAVLFSISTLARSRSIWTRAALLALAVAAIGGAISFISGVGAVDVIKGMPRTSHAALEAHHLRATIASVLVAVVAIAGLVAFLIARRAGEYGRAGLVALSIGAWTAAGSMAWTGLAGGHINHPELQQPEDVQPGPVRAE